MRGPRELAVSIVSRTFGLADWMGRWCVVRQTLPDPMCRTRFHGRLTDQTRVMSLSPVNPCRTNKQSHGSSSTAGLTQTAEPITVGPLLLPDLKRKSGRDGQEWPPPLLVPPIIGAYCGSRSISRIGKLMQDQDWRTHHQARDGYPWGDLHALCAY